MYKNKIKKDFFSVITTNDNEVDLEFENRMISYRFLSEIERMSEAKGINKKELAKSIGTSPSFITQLFRGSKLINLPTLVKFQELFDITFEIKAVPNQIMKIKKNK